MVSHTLPFRGHWWHTDDHTASEVEDTIEQEGEEEDA